MEDVKKMWLVRDKRRLLLAMMELLAGDARISFEGHLDQLGLLSISGASREPTVALNRCTVSPKLDFIVVPLEPSMSETVISAMGRDVPATVIHIQIEKGGILQFGAYDNFDPECMFFGSAVKQDLIAWLVSEGILRPNRRKHSEPFSATNL